MITVGYHGKVGGQFVLRRWHGKMILAKCPDFSKVVWSEKQLAQRARFRKACARDKEPEIIEKYQDKVKPGKTVFNLVFSEVMKELKEI